MKTTIEMAREAAGDDWGLFQEFMPEIHRLAELVRADERARMAEQPAQQQKMTHQQAAQLIREMAAQPAPVQPDETLLSFYQATDFPSLVSAMEGHIKKMQSKLQSNPHTAIDAWNNREMMRSTPQPPAHRTEQHLEMMDAYCKAWEQSFTADNPYHTVKMTADDRKHIEAGLKAALAEQPAQQEPVALEAVYETIVHWDEGGGKRSRRELARRIVALYTSPPAQRKPLTDEVIFWEYQRIWPFHPAEEPTLAKAIVKFARAIEAAHGIKENT